MKSFQKANVLLWYYVLLPVTSFQPAPCFLRIAPKSITPLWSSVGGNDQPPDDGGSKKDNWDDFLDPNKRESENLQKAREYMSEESLPISYDTEEEDDSMEVEQDLELDDDFIENDDENIQDVEFGAPTSTALAASPSLLEKQSAELLQNNPYMKVVSNLSPSDLISKFTTTAHPRVQSAVRATILGLIGSLPKMAFDTTTITTGERLASLMFQLQMTGYMFKNAEYRLSLTQSLGMATPPSFERSSDLLLTGAPADVEDLDEDEDPLRGKVRGKIKLHYGGSGTNSSATKDENDVEMSSDALEMEVDAAAYMSELRNEVSKLREELTEKRQAKEDALRKDLLLYIRTLPKQELRQLTNTISEDVLVGMKGLVNVVMAGIGDGQISPTTVTEQSGEAMAQLCMWQLVVGYNLRELEVREEMKNNLLNGFKKSDDSDSGGVDFSDDLPGILE